MPSSKGVNRKWDKRSVGFAAPCQQTIFQSTVISFVFPLCKVVPAFCNPASCIVTKGGHSYCPSVPPIGFSVGRDMAEPNSSAHIPPSPLCPGRHGTTLDGQDDHHSRSTSFPVTNRVFLLGCDRSAFRMGSSTNAPDDKSSFRAVSTSVDLPPSFCRSIVRFM